jgi:hypothetical protein
MAINFLNNVDYNKNQLLNPRIQNEANDTAAGTPVEGQLYYNTTSNVLKVGREVTPVTNPPTYQWAEVSSSYGFSLSDSANPAITGSIASGDTVKIAATEDLTSNLTGETTTAKTLTVGLKVDGGVGISDNYVVNQGSATAAADDTIPFNNYTDVGTPATSTNVVKKTTFGSIPVDALTLVKSYIDSSVTGGLIYQGGYDAVNNQPDLTTSPNTIKKGWTYTVTVGDTFFGEVLEVGDVLIAEQDDPSSLADWTTVQNNIDIATAGTDTGAGAAVIGISRYDEDDFTVSASGFVELKSTSATGVITAGSLSGTVNHTFGLNTLVQTINSSGDTVHCDVTRTTTSGVGTPSTSVATIAAAEATDITILVKKRNSVFQNERLRI